jgi:cell division septation protein DedD
MDLQAIRDFYANQPVVHMSNQSVIYNSDGTVKQVITGNQAAASPAASPVATAKPSATATPAPATATATPAPTMPSATKTQAPGFEIILAAIGMISALVLITRKKK